MTDNPDGGFAMYAQLLLESITKLSCQTEELKKQYATLDKTICLLKQAYEVNLLADDARFPQLANPVQLQFDTKGRLWVAAWPDYPKWEPQKESKAALLIRHDDNNDGQAATQRRPLVSN